MRTLMMTTPDLPPSTVDPNQQQSTSPQDASGAANTTPEAQKNTVGEPSKTGGSPATNTLPTIPGFEIETELGRGGMGVVYQARQTGLDRIVALKMILRADFATPEQKLRFQIEAENAARVQHPHIVQVYEIGEYQGQPFFAQEYVEGGNLADWLNTHRLAPSAAAALVETLARAMHAAHAQGIIHRDLKPGNILLDGRGQPKITDFGLAKRLAGTEGLTGSGTVMGTPSYMAPEQALGDTRHVGPAADQYALGVIFYQLLTGRLPHEEVSVPALLRMVVEDEPVAPTARSAAVPLDLSIICLKCLEKDPARRYPTAEALADDLRSWREHRPITARRATRSERVVKWCRRYPAVAALIVVSMLASCVAGALAWWAVRAEVAAVIERDAKDEALRKEQAARQQAETHLDYARRGNEILGSIFAGLDPKVDYATIADLRNALKDNLTKAIAELDGSAIGDPLEVAAMQNTLGLSLMGLGEPVLAIAVFEKARATRTAKLGRSHPDTLQSMANLASGYRAAGKLDQALPLYEETLQLGKAARGPDHPETLTGMNNLALAYQNTGKLDLALPLYEETLELRKANLGPDHPDTIASMGNLAVGYQAAGKLNLALPLYEEALRHRKAIFGPDHPETLGSMNNLASGYEAAGKLDLALPLYEETLELRKAKLGRDHLDTLTSMNNLAGSYRVAGKLDLALSLYEETRQRLKAKLGLDHPDTLACMNNLAVTYQANGAVDQALPLLEETLQILKGKLGSNHRTTLASMNNLAAAYRAAGKLDQALFLYEETLQLRTATLGPDHPETFVSMSNLATGYQAARKFDQALPLHEETYKRMLAKLGPDHPYTLTSMKNLASSYESAGKLDQALPIYEQTLTLMQAKFGPDHPSTCTVMNNLGSALSAAGQGDKAAIVLKEFVAAQRRKVPRNDPRLAGILAQVSLDLLKCKQFAAAEQMLREALAIREKTEPDAWTTFNTRSMLGAALLGQRNYAEAEAHLVKGYEGIKERLVSPGSDPKLRTAQQQRLSEALDRLIELYTALEQPDEVRKWQAERAKVLAADPQ